MYSKSAIKVIKKRLEDDPELQLAYFEEKRNYHIACKIREYRKRAGLTQKQLAKRIKTKQSVISRLENAEYKGHSLPVLEKIATALNEPIESFIRIEQHTLSPITFPHPPQVIKHAASFIHWLPRQIIGKRPHAR